MQVKTRKETVVKITHHDYGDGLKTYEVLVGGVKKDIPKAILKWIAGTYLSEIVGKGK